MPTPKQQPNKNEKIEQIWLAKQLLEQKTSYFHSQFKQQASTAIITAFGLVVALAWKDVITDLINKLNPFNNSNLVFSAIIVTLIAVIGITIVSKWVNTGQLQAK